MNALIIHPLIKVLAALLVCAGCGITGWWWHRPSSLVERKVTTKEQLSPPALREQPAAGDDALAKKIQATDPFALQRTTAQQPAATTLPGAAASDVIVWRFAAITSNRGEYQLLMTAAEQVPLLLKKGDKLPNGERIASIQANGIQLQNARGQKRTIELIEP